MRLTLRVGEGQSQHAQQFAVVAMIFSPPATHTDRAEPPKCAQFADGTAVGVTQCDTNTVCCWAGHILHEAHLL